MSRRRKNAKPAEQPAAAPVPAVSEEQLKALADRLAALEQPTAPEAPWSPLDRHRAERAAWLKANIRTDHTAPCPACGVVGGEQRQTGSGAQLLALRWLCVDCTGAVELGWGTNRVTTPSRAVCLDRMASLAAGQADPTPGFRTLAARYGLVFSLARDAAGGDGTAWSHLGDLDLWRSVGGKAVRRHAAGFGVLPAVNAAEALHPESLFVPGPARIHNPSAPAWVDQAPELPTQEETAARLVVEETAIEQQLKAQARAAKERQAQAERDRRESEIRAHYREHRAQLEKQIARTRTELRGELDSALRAHAVTGL